MIRKTAIVSALTLLTACGDPLGGLERISEVDLASDDPTAQALPSEEEIAREGFFGTGAVLEPSLGLTEEAPATAPAQRRGLLGLLRRAAPVAPVEEAPAEAALVDDQAETSPVVSEADNAQAASDALQPGDIDAAVALASLPDEAARPTPPKRQGFFARLTRREPPQKTETTEPIEEVTTEVSDEAPLEEGTSAEKTAPVQKTPRRGLFARLGGAGSSAGKAEENALPEVEYGAVVPHGVIARSCASRSQALGRRVEKSSASGYQVYDSNPRTTEPRTFYITGFGDGCPRQLTAAHVLLGAPSFYELLHYGPAGKHLTFGATDKAYEKVKRQVCGTGKGKPCGAKMKQLERSTIFVNSYLRPDDNTQWSEQLLHKGQVMASAMKSSN